MQLHPKPIQGQDKTTTKLQHTVQTTPPAAMSFTGVLRRNGYFGRRQRARRPKAEGVRSRAAFRSVGEAGSVQHKAKRLAQPLEVPPLVTVDEGGQPRDVRVSTLQFVAGMGRYAVLPCYVCRRTCKGTMTAEASRAAGGAGGITMFALIPAIVFAFGLMDLSPTEAFAAVVGIAVVLCFDYTGKGQLSDVLESTTIDPLDANIGPAPLSKDEVPRIVVLMCIGGGVAAAYPLLLPVPTAPPLPPQRKLLQLHGLHHLPRLRRQWSHTFAGLIRSLYACACTCRQGLKIVPKRVRSIGRPHDRIIIMLRALPSALHKLLALDTYATPQRFGGDTAVESIHASCTPTAALTSLGCQVPQPLPMPSTCCWPQCTPPPAELSCRSWPFAPSSPPPRCPSCWLQLGFRRPFVTLCSMDPTLLARHAPTASPWAAALCAPPWLHARRWYPSAASWRFF